MLYIERERYVYIYIYIYILGHSPVSTNPSALVSVPSPNGAYEGTHNVCICINICMYTRVPPR